MGLSDEPEKNIKNIHAEKIEKNLYLLVINDCSVKYCLSMDEMKVIVWLLFFSSLYIDKFAGKLTIRYYLFDPNKTKEPNRIFAKRLPLQSLSSSNAKICFSLSLRYDFVPVVVPRRIKKSKCVTTTLFSFRHITFYCQIKQMKIPTILFFL